MGTPLTSTVWDLRSSKKARPCVNVCDRLVHVLGSTKGYTVYRKAPVTKLLSSHDLIIDLGANSGDDSDFYLRKGFRVVAVEANPRHVEKLIERFSKEIAEGRIAIIGKGIHRDYGKIEFYVHDLDPWSAFDKSGRFWDGNHEVISVETIPLSDVLNRFGVPYYLKIDLEGLELIAIEWMIPCGARPHYISVEIEPNTPEILHQLRKFGYNAFKVMDQSAKNQWETVIPPLD